MKYDKKSITVNILQIYVKITQFNVKIAIICENMCEEGSESKYGSEEGLNVRGELSAFLQHKSVNHIMIRKSMKIIFMKYYPFFPNHSLLFRLLQLSER